jgi:hypothetical protein
MRNSAPATTSRPIVDGPELATSFDGFRGASRRLPLRSELEARHDCLGRREELLETIGAGDDADE